MRRWIAALAGAAALISLPAYADHHRHYVSRPYVGFGYGVGYPWGFYRPFYYDPFWYGPTVGIGVRVDRNASRRDRAADEPTEQSALKMYIYPANGQSEEQTAQDRYQCHVWAVDQSGYDPTLGTGRRSEAEDYTRAFTACMEGRNYVVK